MIDVKGILEENHLRHKNINCSYDPVTGEGCQGDRVRIEINDAPTPTLYLPEQMMREEVCKLLVEHKSIAKIFKKNKEDINDITYFEFWVSLCELRYEYDFEYFAISCIFIRDKISAKDIPFKLNRGQRRLLDRLEKMRISNIPIRIILLKSRQWGGSTLIQLYMYWIQMIHKKNWNSVICAHVRDGSITIRSMFERAIKNMIPINGIKYSMKNFQSTQNIKEIPERGCLITVGTAIEPDSVRSQDAKMAHFSEMAFYPNSDTNNPELLETSIVGSIPAEPLTLVARESTANGVGDYFHTQWENAKRGETAYEAVFVEWFLIDIYSKPFENGCYYSHNGKKVNGTIEDFIKSLNKYELNLFINNKECTLECLHWRRLKRSEMPSEAKMKQDFPSSDIEAFQDSGLPAFRAEDIEAMRKYCKLPISIGTLTSKCSPNLTKLEPKRRKEILSDIQFIEDSQSLEDIRSGSPQLKELKERDKLKIWKYPDDINVSNRYVVVFDPQKGLSEKADWGVITVFDRYWMMYKGKPEVVAEWRGRIDKDISIWIAAQIATYYNNALLVVESNTYESDSKYDNSEFIFDTISDYYKNLYSRTPADKIKEGEAAIYGWHTNKSTKPMVIENYVAELREEGYIERNENALNEARVYEQKKNKSFGAKEGKHDDILMTRMIGCYICRDLPFPKIIDDIKKNQIKKTVGVSSF